MLPIEQLPGVGSKTAQKLGSIGIKSVEELLNYFPYRYEDYSKMARTSEVKDKEEASLRGELASKSQFRSRGGKLVITLRFKTENGSFYAIWFNQPYIIKSVQVGCHYVLAGKVKLQGKKVSLYAPKIREDEGEALGIVPIYHQSPAVKSSLTWRLNKQALEQLPFEEFLPPGILDDYELVELREAYRMIHIPRDIQEYERARIRFATNELLGVYLKAELSKSFWQRQLGVAVSLSLDSITNLLTSIPFKLTKSQEEAVMSIWKEMKNSYPMNKLVVGDVGTGKTVVAALACGMVAIDGKKSAVLCPTQVLAEQHFRTLTRLLSQCGIKVGLVTSGKNVRGDVLVGTHALLTRQGVGQLNDLALVVIDEEQRFGVEQRNSFLKGQVWPHVLYLTATPIPRTVAMMDLGNISYHYLAEKPNTKRSVKTYVVADSKREKMLEFCAQRVTEFDQRVFYVCPVIGSGVKGRGVEEVYRELSLRWKGKLDIGLIHGKTNAEQRDKVMNDFRDGKIGLLVATTVIEVGVDIPKATVMVIDGAENFGLAQLHQLRGRIGRDGSEAFCFLISNDDEVRERLETLRIESDGMQIARKDLAIRGPGEVFGLAQSGKLDTYFEAFWSERINENAKKMASLIALDEVRSLQILRSINPSLANFDLPN